MPKFLHAADLHIDSPLRGLDAFGEGLGDRVRNATRSAFRRLVDRALEEHVTFVVLAGDLFDDAHQSVETSFFIGDELRRLTTQRIPVFLVRGNHDFLGERSSVVWPEGVYEFGATSPQTRTLSELGVAVHGQSFPTKHVKTDLAQGYPAPVPGLLNVGLLHTALEGHAGSHAAYAETSASRLAGRGYGYWALGHVHGFKELEEGGARIVYPGNLQGRHVGEPGARGAVVVHYEGERVGTVERLFCDVLRWHAVEAVLEPTADLNDQVRAAARVVGDATEADRGAGLACAVRLTLRGLSSDAHQLPARALREKVLQALRHEDPGQLLLEELRFSDAAPALLPSGLKGPLDAAFAALVERPETDPTADLARALWDDRLGTTALEDVRRRVEERLGAATAEQLRQKALELGRERLESLLARR